MTVRGRVAKHISLRRLSRVFHRPTHQLRHGTSRSGSPAASSRHSSGSIYNGRRTPSRSLRRSTKTIVPLPEATAPYLPRSSPPQYSVLDPRDRLVIAHPAPSSCQTAFTPSRSSSPASASDGLTSTDNSRASPPRILRRKSTTYLHPTTNRPSSAPLPLRTSRSFSARTPLDRVAESREALHATPNSTTYAHRLQHQQEHQLRQAVLRPRHSTLALRTRQDRHRTPSPRFLNRCKSCRRRLNVFEFPRHLPTKHCRHENGTCSYCLHNIIQRAFEETGWCNVQCPQCRVKLSESEIQRAVLLWQEPK